MRMITLVHPFITHLIPLIYEYKHKISKHILIHDDTRYDTQVAQRLQKGIMTLYASYNKSIDIRLIRLDKDHEKTIKDVLLKIDDTIDQETYLNATGADTVLLLRFSKEIWKHGGKVLGYDKRENTYNKIDQNKFSNSFIEHSMMLNDYLMLCGYKIKQQRRKDEIIKNYPYLQAVFGNIQRLFSIKKMLFKKDKNRYQTLPKTIKTALFQLGLVDKKMKFSDVSYFGLLFEEYIFCKLLAYDFDDILCGITINYNAPKSLDNYSSLDLSDSIQ